MGGGVELMLVKKGAEADLFLEDWYGRKVIVKKRIGKPIEFLYLTRR